MRIGLERISLMRHFCKAHIAFTFRSVLGCFYTEHVVIKLCSEHALLGVHLGCMAPFMIPDEFAGLIIGEAVPICECDNPIDKARISDEDAVRIVPLDGGDCSIIDGCDGNAGNLHHISSFAAKVRGDA